MKILYLGKLSSLLRVYFELSYLMGNRVKMEGISGSATVSEATLRFTLSRISETALLSKSSRARMIPSTKAKLTPYFCRKGQYY